VDWRVKGTVQKVLGFVPGGSRIHLQLQRRVGGLRDFGRECDLRVDEWAVMVRHLRAAGVDIRGATMLELGTGWFPTLPLCSYLAGVGHMYTFDRVRLVERDMLVLLADRLAAHVSLIARESEQELDEVAGLQREMLDALEREMLLTTATRSVVDYRAPGDVTSTGMLNETVDVVFSSSVLEHMPAEMIQASFAEAWRILKPGGVMFHAVNCGDHYAVSDRSLHPLHFLQFSPAEWERWNNAFLYQNRLRACDFIGFANRAGFKVELEVHRSAELDGVRLDPSFAHYTREQLAITSVDFLARK
jgi:SAM-dependent methyltransferase